MTTVDRVNAARDRRGANPWVAVTVLNLGLFMTLLDVTIVNVAIPRLVDDVHASLDQAAWVSNAYVLALAVLLVTAGRLGDLYGPRRMFLVGTAVFTGASALCGLAGTAPLLIAARALQGVGAALVTPQPLTVVTSLFPPERRGAAFSVNGIVGGLATLAGPLLGGVLVTHLSWQWVFYVNVPVGLVSLVATASLVPDVRTGRRHRLDVTGVVLATLALLPLVFGLTEGPRYDWGAITSYLSVPLLLGVGAALLVVLAVQQARRQDAEPLVLFALFRSRDFTLMTATGAGLQFGFIGFLLPFTLYLQSVLGLSALQAGLATAPSAVVNMALSPVFGRWADRHGAREVLGCGLLAFAAGVVLLALTADTGRDGWAFVPAMTVIGVGYAATFGPLIAKAMSAAPPARAGAASGMLNTSRQLGAVLGSAVVTAVLQNRLATALSQEAATRTRRLPAGVREQLRAAFDDAARGGLRVGTGQSGIRLPARLPAAWAAEARRTAAEVYRHAFVTALRPTLLLCAAVLLAAAGCAFASRRGRAGATAEPPTEGGGAPAAHQDRRHRTHRQ
ncbi:DHA2 family efflux MFS transporter permease subunit [Streptomyces sp. NPDC006476]|uniref:DHA2 family efflux MFS transporter permease subunit n=1 Tax=Streptomyces sp. NPDC006476 TaxID=3157175 RepID=UPI0033A93226